MGYYVKIISSDCALPLAREQEALDLLKFINEPSFDTIKRGGSYGQGKTLAKWYAFMPQNYEQLSQVAFIFDALGFSCFKDTNQGLLHIQDYDNKTGQEDIFFRTIGHLLTGSILWEGEEGERFTWQFPMTQIPRAKLLPFFTQHPYSFMDIPFTDQEVVIKLPDTGPNPTALSNTTKKRLNP